MALFLLSSEIVIKVNKSIDGRIFPAASIIAHAIVIYLKTSLDCQWNFIIFMAPFVYKINLDTYYFGWEIQNVRWKQNPQNGEKQFHNQDFRNWLKPFNTQINQIHEHVIFISKLYW